MKGKRKFSPEFKAKVAGSMALSMRWEWSSGEFLKSIFIRKRGEVWARLVRSFNTLESMIIVCLFLSPQPFLTYLICKSYVC